MIRPFLILALTMTACKADETISGYSDNNAVWELIEMNGATPAATVTLTFPEQGKIAGRAPCNRYFGSQTKPLPWFETGSIGSTKMACPNMDEEVQYFQTLEKSTLAEVTKTTLILSDETGPLLTFKRQ